MLRNCARLPDQLFIPRLLLHTQLVHIDLAKPFNPLAFRQIAQISYYTFSIGLLSYIARQSGKALQHRGYDTSQLHSFWTESQAFILMAAVIYVIAMIFKKGLELQTENDLTV